MATVRCPNCQRSLNLPDHREVQTAQCPLCRTTFEAGHKAVPLVESVGPRVETIAPLPPVPRQTPREVPENGPRRDFNFEDESDKVNVEDRRKLQTAAGWLKAMAGIGLGQMVTCCCCEGMILGERGMLREMQGLLLFLYLFLFIALCLIWSSADSMNRRRNYGLVMTGNILALILGGLFVLVSIPGCASGLAALDRGPGESMIHLVAGVLRLVIGLCGVIGSLLGMSACQRPGVQALFRRGGARPD